MKIIVTKENADGSYDEVGMFHPDYIAAKGDAK